MASVLIVDDEPSNLMVYELLVQSIGYETRSLSHPAGVVDLALSMCPDIILLDLILGHDVDGLMVAQALTAAGVVSKLVALTAASLHFRQEDVAAAGFVAYLEKPVTRQQLADVFEQVLSEG